MAIPKIYTENEVLSRIVQGDASAFGQLFEQYYGVVYSAALQYTKVHELAEDVTQQVFLKAWERRVTLATVGKLDSYLFIMARNEIVDLLRKQSHHRKYVQRLLELFEEERDTPETQLVSKQKRALVQQAVDSLPPQQQQVYRYSRDKGLRYDDIALEMGLSPHTVRAHIRTALKTVKTFLEAHKNELYTLIIILLLGLY